MKILLHFLKQLLFVKNTVGYFIFDFLLKKLSYFFFIRTLKTEQM